MLGCLILAIYISIFNKKKMKNKDQKKTQKDLKPVIINKKDNQKAGYGGRNITKEEE